MAAQKCADIYDELGETCSSHNEAISIAVSLTLRIFEDISAVATDPEVTSTTAVNARGLLDETFKLVAYRFGEVMALTDMSQKGPLH